jgi:hypothetical protein
VQLTIVVSPDWDAEDYPVVCPAAKDANFRITGKPDWLIVGSLDGKFTNGTALINCSATKVEDFAAIGIYCEFMTIEDENGEKYAIQVAYINEGNPRIETPENISINANNPQAMLRIVNQSEGILIWQVVECPEWLQLDFPNNPYMQSNDGMPSGLLLKDAPVELFLSFNFSGNISEKMSGQVVIASNDKTNPLKTIQVNVDLGNPSIYFYDQLLDFGKTGTSVGLNFYNQNDGILLWQFTDLPEWLTCSQIKGSIIYDWQNVTFTADRNRVPEGSFSTTIYLNSNDASNPKIPITVKIRNSTANPAGIIDIEGNVTDAWLDKSTGKLYYTTAQPNKLIEFDMVSKTARRLDLTNAPFCFSISDNGQEMAIGQAGQFSILDLNSFELVKELNANYQINDIAWATDDVVTYTPAAYVELDSLDWVDIRTNIPSTGTEYFRIYYRSLIKKIPGHNYMLYTSLILSPSGISVMDVQTKNRQYYTPESIGNFWFSQNGQYLFCSENKIYRVSDLVSRGNITPIATFQTDYYGYYYPTIWIDDHTATNSVWLLRNAGNIVQYEANDFTYVKSLNCTDFYIKNGVEYDVEGKYLFANQAGTELVVLRNATNDQAAWSLEFIPVQ